jgi:transposase
MEPYSEDRRSPVVTAVAGDVKRMEVARVFKVSLPTIKRWLKQQRETGNWRRGRCLGRRQ